MDAETLLEAIGEIDVKYAVEARGKSAHRRGRRYWWMGVAAAAVLAAMAIILPKGPAGPAEGFTTEKVEDLRSITDSYEGTLLAENLLAAGADISDIQLVHRRDMDAYDASGWKELTFTADNDGDEMRVTCTFDAPEGFELPGEPDEETEYGGVTVWIYFTPVDEGEGGRDCRAIFINEGVVYDMDFHIYGDESRDIVREYLELILDAPEGPEGGVVTDALHPLESLMGFTDYKVTMEADSLGSTWHFWLDVDGVETCVAECFGGAGDLGAYSVDLDGDGTPEVVTNNVYGDGVQQVRVFRYSGGVFYVGTVADEYYDGLGFVTWEWVHAVSERYDPERNVFVVENHPQSAEERVETFAGIEPFAFRRFVNSPTDHFDLMPADGEDAETAGGGPAGERYVDPNESENAAEALREVLEGEREFKYTTRMGEVCGSMDIERAGEVMTDGGSEFMAATRFALVDMDGDGVDEAVIEVSKRAGGEEMGFVVLRYSAGEVYGYMFYSREFIGLKEDGTFRGSECASNIEYSRIEFSGLRLEERTFLGSDSYTDWEDDWRHEVYYGAGSEEEYSRLVEEQDEKADVRWVEITGEGVEGAFG